MINTDMKIEKLIQSIICFLLLMSITSVQAEAHKPFALVELYTSEGCSSCPPADQYLSQIIVDAELSNENIIALSFHVDYWNRLGWKDPYSAAAYTQRQHNYARALRSSSVYTPQMVVNGKHGFVGSDRRKGSLAIRQALSRTPTKSIDIRVVDSSEDNVTIEYNVIGEQVTEMLLNLVIAERNIVSKVKNGENSGRTLRHDNVVRVFETCSLKQSPQGHVKLTLPNDLVARNTSIVAFIQQRGQKEIAGAKIIPLL